MPQAESRAVFVVDGMEAPWDCGRVELETIMMNRRRFLAASVPVVGLPVVSGWSAPRAGAQESAGLPPALAALKSRKAEAKPISTAERERRMEKAQALMSARGMDAIVLIGGTSLVYFTGIHWWNSERLFVCVIPKKGAPFYVCPAFEEERAREQMRLAPGGRDSKIYTWQ
ncbi:MAG TPA: aminopeptidase P family N-terminal domain-containing protein, partial [Acidobacteriaceae bacterium]|nr:aminopeptidase P family N-terminal domain-containing protein [Acidobacteriaceae bacterium]